MDLTNRLQRTDDIFKSVFHRKVLHLQKIVTIVTSALSDFPRIELTATRDKKCMLKENHTLLTSTLRMILETC